MRLEAAQIVDWLFQFFNRDEGYRIQTRMERLDTIGDSINVVKELDAAKNNQSKGRRVDAIHTVTVDSRFFVVNNTEDMPAEEQAVDFSNSLASFQDHLDMSNVSEANQHQMKLELPLRSTIH
jgi:hypothetical protein